MRILLAHNSLYYPAHGGGDKSNRLLMEALAARGHEVRVVARVKSNEPVHFTLHGVDIRAFPIDSNLRTEFSAQIAGYDPDVILTSTDDPGQLLFDIALSASRARVVHLVRATIAAPFGPDSAMPSQSKTNALRQGDGIVGVSEYVANYVRRWGGTDAVHVPISLMEPGEFSNLGRFDNPFVAMVNPCAVKGIDIFLALAGRMEHLRFAAIPTWGTNAGDLAALRRLPSVTILDPVDNIDDLLRHTRVVLVPSVWAEARSRIVMEAMLRGVPVIASDAGGIKEAKLGVPYLLPVKIIEHYQPALDENMVPIADVPPQDIAPWHAALDRLTSEPAHWQEIADQSRAAALEYSRSVTIEPFEAYMLDVLRRPKKTPPAKPAAKLSEDKRRLVALRLKKLTERKSAWFPTLDPAVRSRLRLFCFPHAGGGTLTYRSWAGALDGVDVCPALLPGRETRAVELPIDNMSELIGPLTAAIRPFVDVPYAFFGHSMGSGIAFELIRSLRREGAPLPEALIVSAARAPQLRIHRPPGPEPSDEDLLRMLEHVPRDFLKLALPLLRADTRLYRHYSYTPEPPLALPIFAYGGASDQDVRPEHLDPWREQTSAAFVRREFPGGHFYLQDSPAAVLDALNADLQ